MRKIILCLSLLFSVCTFAKPRPLPLANDVDLSRFAGKWYTITSLPQFFTRNCKGQTFEYGIINEQKINVHNVCYKENGTIKDLYGKGVVKDVVDKAQFSVVFDSFWTKLFRKKSDYNIIKLGEGYDTAMVGSNNRKSLWIMSRSPSIDPTTLQNYKDKARALGFSIEQLKHSKY